MSDRTNIDAPRLGRASVWVETLRINSVGKIVNRDLEMLFESFRCVVKANEHVVELRENGPDPRQLLFYLVDPKLLKETNSLVGALAPVSYGVEGLEVARIRGRKEEQLYILIERRRVKSKVDRASPHTKAIQHTPRPNFEVTAEIDRRTQGDRVRL